MVTDDHIIAIKAAIIAPVIAFFTPTNGYILSLILAYGFNIFCGTRADGVSIKRMRNFNMGKFFRSVCELALYVAIEYLLFAIIVLSGDAEESLVVIKSLNYIFCYVYTLNGFKNLTIAYPQNKTFKALYHVLRFEFKKVLPVYFHDAIEKEILKEEGGNDEKKVR